MQTVRKLKAGLSVLMCDDKDKIEEASKRYLEYSTIKLDGSAEVPNKVTA